MSQQKQRFPSYDFTLPPGRLVLGSLIELQTKDNNGRDRKTPIMFFAVAVPKNTPGVENIIWNVFGYARHTYGYVNGGNQVLNRMPQNGQWANLVEKTGFAWKLKDGDHDAKWSQREGCRGCWVFIFNTMFCPIRCCDNSTPPVQIDPRQINLGDFVDVGVSVQINGEVGETAGIYFNPNGVRLLGYGQRIVPVAASFDKLFTGPGALPAGASATPVAAQPMPNQQQGGGGGYQPQQQPQQYQPQQQYAPQGQHQQHGGYAPAQQPQGGGGGYQPAQQQGGGGGYQPALQQGGNGYQPQQQQYQQQGHAYAPDAQGGGGQGQAYGHAGSAGHGGQMGTASPYSGGPAYTPPPNAGNNQQFVNGPGR